MANPSQDQVWAELEKNLFAVVGMVTAHQEARTVGIVYIVRDRKLYFGTFKDTWKTRHITQNGHISMTVPIAKRIPLMPWIKIPAATITFAAEARVLTNEQADPDVLKALYRDVAKDGQQMARSCVIEVTPIDDFITYGVGVPLMQMRFPEKARGRVATAKHREAAQKTY